MKEIFGDMGQGDAPMGKRRVGNHPIDSLVQVTQKSELRNETTQKFMYPIGLVFDSDEGRLIVVDCVGSRLQVYTKEIS